MRDNQTEKGKLASVKGFANESRLLAALLERGFNASKVDLPHSTYDLLVETDNRETIRVQVKTVGKGGSISFKGGVRGGKDRTYRSDVKAYTQNTDTADIVVGVRSEKDNGDRSVDFYFIPTLHIEAIQQQSLSVNKVPQVKNKWEVLRRCKDPDFVRNVFGVG